MSIITLIEINRDENWFEFASLEMKKGKRY
jgi:hypothetical protein